MCKKLICLVSLVLTLGLVGNSSEATISWDDGGSDHLWTTPQNWAGDVPPGSADGVVINIYPGPIIDADVTIGSHMKVASVADANTSVTMNSGTFTTPTANTYCIIILGGYESGAHGTFNMNGGTLDPSSALWVGRDQTGTLNMTGGLIDLTNSAGGLDEWQGGVIIGERSGSTGYANIEGGTIKAAIFNVAHKSGSVGIVNMSGGIIITTGGLQDDLLIGNLGEGHLNMTGGTIETEDVFAPRGFGGGMEHTGKGYINLSNGTITTTQTFTLGITEYGELNMSSGTINVGTDLRCADTGQGILNMSGGTINVGDTLHIAKRNGTGHLQLDGGTINTFDLSMVTGYQDKFGTATMDITGGTLVINGDKTPKVNGYINKGWITAYGGASTVMCDYITATDKTAVWSTEPKPTAWNPSPADDATGVPMDAVLSWTPGPYAQDVNGHDVYFGTRFTDVNDANKSSSEYKGSQNYDVNTYSPGLLDWLGKTYYWRVDEVNDACAPGLWEGNVWNFTTIDYFVVEDMEAYPDRDSIRTVWKDGYTSVLWQEDPPGSGNWVPIQGGWSGSNITVATDPNVPDSFTHEGSAEAMAYSYDNDGDTFVPGHPDFNYPAPYYSEIEARTTGPNSLDVDPNWTKSGAKALSLWFYGDPNNDAEQMYVKLNGSKVVYDGDADDIRIPLWHEWNIELAELGIDLQNVTKIYIGFGNENNNSNPGGSGIVYFDDIRLYSPRCIPSLRQPLGDLDNDCDVDYEDLNIMAENWLESFVWDVTDGYDGNGCLELDGAGQRIFVPGAPFPRNAFTYALWFNPDTDLGAGTGRTDFIYWDPRVTVPGVPGARPCLVQDIDGSGRFRVHILLEEMELPDLGLLSTDSNSFSASTWHHIAFTFDGASTEVYVGGILEKRLNFSGTHIDSFAKGVHFGAKRTGDNAFDGKLDDIRIYGEGLSQADIELLADTNPATEPAAATPLAWNNIDETSSGTAYDSSGNGYDGVVLFTDLYSNPYNDNKVNFKDFAVVAGDWLAEQLWPMVP